MMNDPLFHIDMTFDGKLPEEEIRSPVRVQQKIRGKFPDRAKEPQAVPAPAMPHAGLDIINSPRRTEDVPVTQAEMEAEL